LEKLHIPLKSLTQVWTVTGAELTLKSLFISLEALVRVWISSVRDQTREAEEENKIRVGEIIGG
jgi:hypothetical protein